MNILFIEADKGVADDLLLAALLDLCPDSSAMVKRLKSIGFTDIDFATEKIQEENMWVTGLRIDQAETEGLMTLDLAAWLKGLSISAAVRKDVQEVCQIVCKIRSAVEKQSGLDVTSQSIYTMNELIRIVCICFILHELDVDYIIASPLNVHTPIDTSLQYQMPIPIQKSVEGGIERKRGEVNHPSRFVAVLNQFFSEICPSVNILQVGLWTAPGAACLAHFVNEFRFQPMMQIKSIGRGLKSNNWVGGSLQRLFIGELDHLSSVNEIYKIECNIDDMTGEEMGFVIEQLLRTGVRDVYMVPVYMKKIAPVYC